MVVINILRLVPELSGKTWEGVNSCTGLVVGDLRLDFAQVVSDFSDVLCKGLSSQFFGLDLSFQFLDLHGSLSFLSCRLSSLDFSLQSLELLSLFGDFAVMDMHTRREDILGDVFGVVIYSHSRVLIVDNLSIFIFNLVLDIMKSGVHHWSLWEGFVDNF